MSAFDAYHSGSSGSPTQERPRLLSTLSRAAETLLSPHHHNHNHSQRMAAEDRVSLRLAPSAPLLSSSSSSSPLSPHHPSPPRWQPTRLTSPYRVLSAASLPVDFYTGGLSWGRQRLAIALTDDLLLFDPAVSQQQTARACLAQAQQQQQLRPTSVAMSRFSEASCFAGFAHGTAMVFAATESGLLAPTVSFDLPESAITGYSTLLLDLARGGGGGGGQNGIPSPSPSSSSAAALTRAAGTLSRSAESFTGIGCLATTDAHPWSAALGTSSRGLIAVDARTRRPATLFGSQSLRDHPSPSSLAATTTINAGSSGDGRRTNMNNSSSSSSSGGGNAGTRAAVERLSCLLRSTDRICSVDWNVSGSLVATGTGGGLVKVWSLASPRAPLHVIAIGEDVTVKALSFHPSRPYELLVGGCGGGGGSLRIYDIGGAGPRLAWSANGTGDDGEDGGGEWEGPGAGAGAGALLPAVPATTQALYSPDGAYIVSAHGAAAPFSPPTTTTAPSPSPPPPQQQQQQRATALDLGLQYNPFDSLAAAAATMANTSGGGSGGGISLAASVAATARAAVPSYALAVWKRADGRDGVRRVRSDLHRAFFNVGSAGGAQVQEAEDEAAGYHDDNQGGNSFHYGGQQHRSDDHSDSEDRPRRSRHGISSESGVGSGDGVGPAPRRLHLLYCLPGHRGRPLHLAAPFHSPSSAAAAASPSAGCFVSQAGGEDRTIRFWRVFEPSPSFASGGGSGSPTTGAVPAGYRGWKMDEAQLR